MKRILANALFATAMLGPPALVLSADGLGPTVDERLVMVAPAGGQLLHPAVDLGAREYPLPLLPADGAQLVHTGLFETDTATVFLPAVVLESDVSHGDGCSTGLLRVAEVETEDGRFGLILAPAESPAVFGSEFRVAAPATLVSSASSSEGCPTVPSI